MCSMIWTRVESGEYRSMYKSIYARNVVNPVEEQGRLDVDAHMAERKAAASAMQTAFSPGLSYAKDILNNI